MVPAIRVFWSDQPHHTHPESIAARRCAPGKAELTGLSRRTVYSAEKGDNPTLRTIVRLLRLYGGIEALRSFIPEPEISPIHLPTSLRGPIGFDELRRSPAFAGLPGVLADALPDAFGNRVIRAYFAARGESERSIDRVVGDG